MKRSFFRAVLSAWICVLLLCTPLLTAFSAESTATGPQLFRLVPSANGYAMQWQDGNGAAVSAAYPGRSGRPRLRGQLPAQYDSRSKGWITSVKNQDLAGICWACSSVSAMETDAIRQGLVDVNTVDWSEAHLAWFAANSYTTDKNDPTYGDGMRSSFLRIYGEGGNGYMVVAALARGSSMANETDFPFPGDFQNKKSYDEKDRYISVMHIAESEVIDSFEDAAAIDLRSEIKQQIMEHGSVTAMLYASASDAHYNTATIDGVTSTAYYQSKVKDPLRSDHMITIVGWDDNYSTDHFYNKDRPANSGAWIVKNSWGTDAPIVTDGYNYISYDEPTLADFTAYTALPVDAFDRIYQYDGFGCNSALHFEADEAVACANVFTPDQDQYLDRVGYYTAMGDSTMVIEVYNHLTDATDPESGALVCRLTENERYAGYHTVTLPRLAALTKGSPFSIVLRGAEGKVFDAPVEVNLPTERFYAAKEGQSFIYTEEEGIAGWNDATLYRNHNLFAGQLYSVCNVTAKGMVLDASRHTHDWGELKTTAPSCTQEGTTARHCSGCDALDIKSTTPATGHHDNNSDQRCDDCGKLLIDKDACPLCGEVHTGFFGGIVAFFHQVIFFFKKLFQR